LFACARQPTFVVISLANFGTATASAHSTFCANGLSADSTVHDTTQVTQRPVLYEAPVLHYPAPARERHIQGRVLLAVTINGDGHADGHSIQALSTPDSALTIAAMEWVRHAKFEPVCLAGQAVRVRIVVPVDFVARQ
jgi:TonB family protein